MEERRMSPQARRRLLRTMQEVELRDLAYEISVALQLHWEQDSAGKIYDAITEGID